MLRSLKVRDEPSLARDLELELADQFPPGSRIIPWRAVNAPHLVALVRAGARFERGIPVERDTAVGA
jgi:hypothetical protein